MCAESRSGRSMYSKMDKGLAGTSQSASACRSSVGISLFADWFIVTVRFEISDSSENALEEMEAKELGSAIERAIASLRPEYRSCIMLRHVEGRSYEEIASTLDLPLGTVKTYIHRARHELRRALEHTRE